MTFRDRKGAMAVLAALMLMMLLPVPVATTSVSSGHTPQNRAALSETMMRSL